MSRRSQGAHIERRMQWYLRVRGYRIVCANYYSPYGEIDIIAHKGNTTVFVEVRSKTEKSASLYATPAESVTAAKQRSIIKTARHYITTAFLANATYRFDVIEVIRRENGRLKINHIKNAFICDMNNSH